MLLSNVMSVAEKAGKRFSVRAFHTAEHQFCFQSSICRISSVLLRKDASRSYVLV